MSGVRYDIAFWRCFNKWAPYRAMDKLWEILLIVYISTVGYTIYEKYLQEIFGREKIGELWVICQNFPTNIYRYTENVFVICTACSLFAKFFLANTFYLYGLPKFSLPIISQAP